MNTTYEVGALSKALKTVKTKKVNKGEGREKGAELDKLFAARNKRPGPLYVPYTPVQLELDEKRLRKRQGGDDDDDDDNEQDNRKWPEMRKKRWPGKLKLEEMKKIKQEEEERTVFVGNLPKTMGRQEIGKVFRIIGKIDTIRIRSASLADPSVPRRVATITRDFHANRNNLNAYVRFRTVKEAKTALKLNGTLVGKFHIRVDMANNNGRLNNKRSVFVGNLPFSIEEDTVFSHFEDCGEIEGVRLIRDSKTGIGKGFGYVIFKTSDPVEIALHLDGSDLDGRPLRVSRAVNKPNRNFNASKVKLTKKHEAKTARKAMKKSLLTNTKPPRNERNRGKIPQKTGNKSSQDAGNREQFRGNKLNNAKRGKPKSAKKHQTKK